MGTEGGAKGQAVTQQNFVLKLSASGAQAVVTDLKRVADTMVRIDGSAAIASKGLEALTGGLRGLGGLVIGAGITNSISKITDGLAALKDASDATGASIDKLAGLEAISRKAGGNFDTVTTAIIKLNQQLNQSDGADSKSVVALKAIGLDVEELKKLDPADALKQVAIAFGKFADDGDKARLAQTQFGKALREVAPLLHDIAEATDTSSASLAAAVEEQDKFEKSIARLGFQVTGLGRSLLGPVVEGFNNYIDRVQAATAANKGFFESTVKEGVFGENGVFRIGKLVQERDRFQTLLKKSDISDQVRRDAEQRVAALKEQIAAEKQRQFGPAPSLSTPDRPSVGPNLDAEEAKAEAAKKTAAARDKAASALRQAEAEAKLRADIQVELADQRLLLELVMRGVDVEEARLRIQLTRKGLTPEQIDQTLQLKAAIDAQVDSVKALAAAEEAEIKARQEIIDYAVSQEQAAAAQVASIEQQIEAQLRQNETIGVTGVALVELEAARLGDAAAEAIRRAEVLETNPVSQAEAGRVRELAARYLELADAKLAGAIKQQDVDRAADAIKRQQDEAQELQKVFGQVGQSLTNALFNGFESGKGFARSLRDTVVNTFKTLVIRIPLQGVITSLTSAVAGALGFSGAAQASGLQAGNSFGGGFLNALSGGKTIFDALNGSITSGLTSFAGQLGSLGFNSGAQFVNGFASALNGGSAASFSGASSAFNLGNFAGQAAPFIPGIISAFQGDFKSAAFQTAGAAIGTAIGGPIGGAIGSTIGSIVSGLFGSSGGTPHLGGGAGAQVSETGALLERNLSNGTKNKGFTDPVFGTVSAFGTSKAAVGDALQPLVTQVAQTLQALTGKAVKVSSALGADGEDAAQARIRIAIGDTSVLDQFYHDFVSKDIKKAGDALQKLLTGSALVFAIQQSDAAAYIKDAFSQFNVTKTDKKGNLALDDKAAVDPAKVQAQIQAVVVLQQNLDRLTGKFGITAEQIVKIGNASGDLGAVLQQMLARLGNQYITQQLVDDGIASLTTKLTKLGVTTMPTTVAEFDALIRGVDKTTKSGQDLTKALLDLGPGFDQLVGVRDVLARVAEAIALTGQTSLKVTDALLTGAGGFEGLAAGIDAFVNGILSPQQRLTFQTEQTAEQFAKLGLALPGSAGEFASLVAGLDTSTEAGQKLYGQVIGLAPAFVALQSAIEGVSGTVDDSLAQFAATREELLRRPSNLIEAAARFRRPPRLRQRWRLRRRRAHRR